MKKDDAIRLIQKLSLRGVEKNSTQAEVEQSTTTIQSLMLKFNLTREDITSVEKSSSPIWVTEKAWEGKGRTWEMDFILEILRSYFYIKVISQGGHIYGREILEFFGDKDNVTTSQMVWHFLRQEFRRLWQIHRKEKKLSHGDSRSFYHGLQHGLMDKLEENLAKTVGEIFHVEGEIDEEAQARGEQALIAMGNQLDEALGQHHPKLVKKYKDSAPTYQGIAYNTGKKVGAEISIPSGASAKITGTLAITDGRKK